ncbi:MAG TPA: LLM class flavin-dependent oxidoreductase [Chloroflexota bacterium]|nr:LLM class flavin-dependent oxidoreductase [Chloroflexota bacterium]
MPKTGRFGAALHEFGAANQLAAIELADRLGVPTAWLTTGGAGPDAMAIFAAAAVRTERIQLGTAIIPMFPRHPLNLVQQAIVIAALAPGRLRLGVGTSHRPSTEPTFGIPFERPLEYLEEYVAILRAALHEGKVSYEGKRLTARAEIPLPQGAPRVPILISALRPASYRLAGRVSDGALAWVSPLPYLAEQALPALRKGARDAGRDAPPLIAHCFVAVHDSAAEVRAAACDRLAVYARLPFYQEMFALAGFPEARQGAFSDAMLDAVVLHGDESAVAAALNRYLAAGMGEVICSVLVAGPDRHKSLERTLTLLASL